MLGGIVYRNVNNLFLERSVLDLLRVVIKQYGIIEIYFSSECPAEQTYSRAELGEDIIKQHFLNVFEIKTAIMDFSLEITKTK